MSKNRAMHGRRAMPRLGALTIAGGLTASLCLVACSEDSSTTTGTPTASVADTSTTAAAPAATDAPADSDWDNNGAPTVLKTAPTGTPLGAPAKNTVFACIKVTIPGTYDTIVLGQTVANQLTQAQTPWVQDGNVVISKIDTVPGNATLESVFDITETGTTRRLKGNGIPNHPIGVFPIPQSSSSYQYYAALPAEGYANAAEIPVKPYDLDVTLPLNPEMSATPNCIAGLMTGVALTGAAWHVEMAPDSLLNVYDPNAALPSDRCFGHPYATEYHYHGYSWKCMDQGTPGEPSPLLGYAMDGFGIYGPRGADGKPITNAQLDECHGRVGEVMFNGKLQNIYHYVLNNEYPYSIGCFRGTVQASMHGM